MKFYKKVDDLSADFLTHRIHQTKNKPDFKCPCCSDHIPKKMVYLTVYKDADLNKPVQLWISEERFNKLKEQAEEQIKKQIEEKYEMKMVKETEKDYDNLIANFYKE